MCLSYECAAAAYPREALLAIHHSGSAVPMAFAFVHAVTVSQTLSIKTQAVNWPLDFCYVVSDGRSFARALLNRRYRYLLLCECSTWAAFRVCRRRLRNDTLMRTRLQRFGLPPGRRLREFFPYTMNACCCF